MNKKIILFVTLIVAIAGGILTFTKTIGNSSTKFQNANPISNTQTSTATHTQQSYTMSDVAQHKDKTSCWTAINGNVYDLTSFVEKHPGGSMRILSICGADGSQAFNGQHGTKSRPNNELDSLYIGMLQ